MCLTTAGGRNKKRHNWFHDNLSEKFTKEKDEIISDVINHDLGHKAGKKDNVNFFHMIHSCKKSKCFLQKYCVLAFKNAAEQVD